MSRTLKIIPRFGLGNRLIAIASALRLKQLGYFDNIRVQWESSNDLNANFNDLLEINDITLTGPEDGDIHVGIPHKHTIPNHNRVTVEVYDLFTVVDDPNNDSVAISREIAASFQKISFLPRFYKLADQYNVTGRIGLHCRRSDYPFSKPPADQTIIPRYHNLIDKEFAADIKGAYHGPFFLASDSAKTEAYFTAAFSGLLMSKKKAYPEWSTRPMDTVIEGVVDMILLSRCKLIVADSHSTFATVAAWMGAIEKFVWVRPETI